LKKKREETEKGKENKKRDETKKTPDLGFTSSDCRAHQTPL
jgi:hypothetical protein